MNGKEKISQREKTFTCRGTKLRNEPISHQKQSKQEDSAEQYLSIWKIKPLEYLGKISFQNGDERKIFRNTKAEKRFMSSTFVLQKMLKEMSEVKWYQAEMHTYQRKGQYLKW